MASGRILALSFVRKDRDKSLHIMRILSCLLLSLSVPVICGSAQAEPRAYLTAVARAWATDPVRNELIVNEQSAEARASAAKSWFAGGPELSGTYLDDHFIGSNVGYTTYQGSLSVPLWLPGQGTATRKVAEADAATAEARLDVEHMSIAVRVLDATGAVLIARKQAAIAHASENALAQIVALTREGVTHGEFPSTDLEAATSELAQARTDYALAQEQISITEAAFAQLTGDSQVPDIESWDEITGSVSLRRTTQEIEQRDPRTQAVLRNVVAAQEGMKLARRSYMPNPKIGIDVMKQGQYQSPWDTQVGFHASITLPSDVQNAPIMTEAANRMAAATREEVMTRRTIRNEIAQVRARVIASRNTLDNARNALDSLKKRAADMKRAWQLSEQPLIETLRAQQAAWEAERAMNKAEIGWHASLIRMIIACNDLPGGLK